MSGGADKLQVVDMITLDAALIHDEEPDSVNFQLTHSGHAKYVFVTDSVEAKSTFVCLPSKETKKETELFLSLLFLFLSLGKWVEQLEELSADEFERKQMELENEDDDEDELDDILEELPEEPYFFVLSFFFFFSPRLEFLFLFFSSFFSSPSAEKPLRSLHAGLLGPRS